MSKCSDRNGIYPFRSWRDITPMLSSVGTMRHNRTGSWRFVKPVYADRVPPCQNACPSGNDIEGWIRLLQQGDREGAWWHLKREEPFPAILGRVCFRFCEAACNRSTIDGCLNIRHLERYVGDGGPHEADAPFRRPENGKRLAVVGSGPAGMSAAYFARLLGFSVTVFERLAKPGGILRVGIPAYRLPREVLEREFSSLRRLGVEIRTGVSVGDDIGLGPLAADHDYLFLATGCHQPIRLPLEGASAGDRVLPALDFLRRSAEGRPHRPGGRVVVVGGGNTAIDAARTAVRLGCAVTVVYRRTRPEMPAHDWEVEEALQEGIDFRFLAAPIRVEAEAEGGPLRLVCTEMTLGDPGPDGRRRPVPVADRTFEIAADTVLTAIGEEADLVYLADRLQTESGFLAVAADQSAGAPGIPVYAGGDMIGAERTVIHAVAHGKRAAVAMDCHRRGLDPATVLDGLAVGTGTGIRFADYIEAAPLSPVHREPRSVAGPDRIVADYFRRVPPTPVAVRSPEARRGDFDPYEEPFNSSTAAAEAKRCLHCGRCTECDNCRIFCPDLSIHKATEGGFGYTVDYAYCKGCGICSTECPRGAISMVAEDAAADGSQR
ncbi:MAG: FAD-dependent oxidoreductase [Desulfobacteraceae bacterium]|nr:FAD-dependent oxidoreductase [Desulfobacteraceae bacterium]